MGFLPVSYVLVEQGWPPKSFCAPTPSLPSQFASPRYAGNKNSKNISKYSCFEGMQLLQIAKTHCNYMVLKVRSYQQLQKSTVIILFLKVWRYQHWDSNTPFLQKRATLTACLRKVQQQASDPAAMIPSALDKIAEFRRLRYPESVLSKACNFLGASTGEGTWITVRNALGE